MPSKNRVIWKEGLFIKPQHFQQQQRHNDFILHGRLAAIGDYFYGFQSVEINHELLKLGKLGLSTVSGVMPDGTLFDIPHQDISPSPLEITNLNDPRSRDIYLALPIVNDAISEIDTAQNYDTVMKRYTEQPLDVRDLHTRGGDVAQLAISQLAPRLMQGSDDLSAYTTLPLCRIREKRPDGALVLDNDFIPTCATINASSRLREFMDEVAGVVAERAKHLSLRIGSPGQQGIADVAEFMMLQMLNRWKPEFTHLAYRTTLSPEIFYRAIGQLCAELMTFTDESRLPPNFQVYNHDNLTETFEALIISTRLALNTVLTPRAISIQLRTQSHGIRVATINDRELLRSAEFVLAVRAILPQEQLRKMFVQQTKITSVEKIRDLVSVQLPGVPLLPLATAPRQLPYHSGYTYFSLDRNSPAWQELQQGTAIAFHVAGDFPDLDMQFWAIRGN